MNIPLRTCVVFLVAMGISYGENGQELYDLREDPNEWSNLAERSEFDDVIEAMRRFAPEKWAEPEVKLNARKDLVIEGESFRWEKGKGNYKPRPKYRPYSSPADAN